MYPESKAEYTAGVTIPNMSQNVMFVKVRRFSSATGDDVCSQLRGESKLRNAAGEYMSQVFGTFTTVNAPQDVVSQLEP